MLWLQGKGIMGRCNLVGGCSGGVTALLTMPRADGLGWLALLCLMTELRCSAFISYLVIWCNGAQFKSIPKLNYTRPNQSQTQFWVQGRWAMWLQLHTRSPASSTRNWHVGGSPNEGASRSTSSGRSSVGVSASHGVSNLRSTGRSRSRSRSRSR